MTVPMPGRCWACRVPWSQPRNDSNTTPGRFWTGFATTWLRPLSQCRQRPPQRRCYRADRSIGTGAGGRIVTLGLAVFPNNIILAILLFAVCPALLLAKWVFEAYAGPELHRACDVLDERANDFRRIRRRIVRVAEAVALADGSTDARLRSALAPDQPDEVMTRLRFASISMRHLAEQVEHTTRVTRLFANGWFDDPINSCTSYQNESAAIDPDLVRRGVAEARSQLGELAFVLTKKLAVDRRQAGGRAGQPLSTAADEIEAIVQEVALSEVTIGKELSRLERTFDSVHHAAATQVIKTRVPTRLSRTAAVVGMTAAASTLSRARRTTARAVFVDKTLACDSITLGSVGRAVVAMRTAA